MNWWDALNAIAKDFPEGDPYIEDFRSGMYGKSNALFEPVKTVTTHNSLSKLRGDEIYGSELGGDVQLSKQSPDPLKSLLHEISHTSQRPGNIAAAHMRPDAWAMQHRPMLEFATDIMADGANNIITGAKKNFMKSDSIDELMKLLLNRTPLESGTRAGRIIK